MTEDLDERGEPAQEGPPHGTSRYNSKKWRCRCDVCKQAKRNQYLAAQGRAAEAASLPYFPKRPPGMVWMDSTEFSHVVRCERCDKNYGTWTDKWEAQAFQERHNAMHAAAKEPAMNWHAWSKERLIKNPGGRPPLEDKPLCTLEDCSEDAHAKGLCSTHYKRAQRAGEL